MWRDSAVAEYRVNRGVPANQLSALQLNALNTLAFFDSTVEHQLSRTANVVGLSMPRKLRDDETRQGGGKTMSEI
ncbi:hypothetical protein HK100_008978, partial [Physocladia obscura]